MRKHFVFLFLSLTFSCGPGARVTETGNKSTAELSEESTDLEPQYCKEITNQKDLNTDNNWQQAFIMDYQLKDGCICILYQYSGCQEAESYLTWDGHWPSEFDPVINMQLGVKGAGMCEMLLEGSACFSVKKLAFGGDKVTVTINGASNRLAIDFTEFQ